MNALYQVKIADIWGYLKKEDALFWLINLYLFFEYVRPQYIYPILDFIPYTQLILIVTTILFLFTKGIFSVDNALNKLLILYLTVIILSSFTAFDPGLSFQGLEGFLTWLLIYFLIINIINTEERIFIFLLAFLLYNFKMSFFSLRGWAASGFSFSNWGSGGGPGWFSNSGEFGVEMCVFLPLAAYFVIALRSSWPVWKKMIFLLFPLSACTSMVSSSSRGAVIGGTAVFLWMFLKGKHLIRGMLILVTIAGFIYMILPEEQKARFEAAGEDKTSLSRIERWEKGLKMAEMYPLLGVGFENWSIADRTIFQGGGGESHNIFIECMSELGYTGLAVFVLMILYTLINNYRTRKIAQEQLGGNRFFYYMAHGLDGSLVGYLVSGFFVTVLYYPYFWINLAITVALHNSARVEAMRQG